MRCGECGSKTSLVVKNLKGRTFPWKDYPGVVLSVDLINDGILTCSLCDNMVMRAGSARSLDQAIEDSIRNELSLALGHTWIGPLPNFDDYTLFTK